MTDIVIHPLISIIVRTKDRPKLLKKSLQSITEQTYRPIEVVLVNDGGCDLDLKEIEEILQDVELHYIQLDKNTGRAHSGNVGIEHAKGAYIGFLDDDDQLYPEHIEILMSKLKYSPLKIVYSEAEVVFVDMDGGDELIEKFKYVFNSKDFSPEMLLIQNYIPFICLLFDKTVFDDVRFDETFEIFEDWTILIELSRRYWFEPVKKVTAKYVQWSNESQINRRALSEDFSQKAYKKVLEKNMTAISPAAIYTFCVIMATEKMKLLHDLQDKTEIAKKLGGIEAENKQLIDEKEKLLHEVITLQTYIAEMTGSLSWQLIERYRKLKDSVAPLGSRRRIYYEMFIKGIKILQREGIKGIFLRIKRNLRFNHSLLKLKSKFIRPKEIACDIDPRLSDVSGFFQKPVHIIMPVYNGYDHLVACIETIFRHTDLRTHTLVILDDKSTDQRIIPYLYKLQKGITDEKVRLSFNADNLGFVRTINKGMKLSDEDVIILNSDTLVTKNWIKKLQRAAYSKPRVATATPLSNYVTINGIPEPFHYNTIPLGMDVETFSAFIEGISLRYYPEVPAGLGFCMYIKKYVLEELNYFDETRFEKGYAEETDFCMRALKKGFVNVLDDSTYIYHFGGVSFESVRDQEMIREKNFMIERNLKTLRALHPEYCNLVEKALNESLRPVHQYINLRLALLENSDYESTLCDRSKA